MSLYRRLVNACRGANLDRELDDELEFHREMRRRKAIEQGLSPAEAERDAKRRMGGLELARDEMRDARVIGWIASSVQDVRHGAVLLRRDAWVSSLIVMALAIGIGGTSAVFTLLKAAFLDPLPYPAGDRLITILEERRGTPRVSDYEAIRARSRTLEQVTFTEHRDMQILGTSEPIRVFVGRVTASFFPLLGVRAALGRTFVEEESQPGRAPAVVLTDGFWKSRMRGDPDVIGRVLRLDGAAAVVVGVLPAGFHFDYPTLRIAEPVDIYVSFPIEYSAPDVGWARRLLARVQEHATHGQAKSELRDIAQTLIHEHPEAYRSRDGGPRRFTLEAVTLREAIVGAQRSLLLLLLGGAGVLLLIACANTAQLLLARSLRRGREVAIRTALGASRFRLIRQFLMEGTLLAICGGAIGLLISGGLRGLLVGFLPVRSPLLYSVRMDTWVIAFTFGISMVSALMFAIVPAIKGSKWTPGPALNVRSTTAEPNRWRHLMIAVEASLSVFLLCAAGLVTQNLWSLRSTPLGFDPNHVLAMRVKLPSGQSNASQRLQEYLARIAAIPGVDSAATATGPPLRPSISGPTEIVGVTDETGGLKSVIADNHLVSADYFRTLRIPLLAGRTFTSEDRPGRPPVAIVNEEFARRFGLHRNVVGKQIFEPGQPMFIVGMVGNVRTRGLRTEPFPEVYISALQFSSANVYVVVRSGVPPHSL